MAQTNPQAGERDIDTLARTLYGEARGEGFAGMLAVAHVVFNRVRQARAFRERTGRDHPLFGDGTITSACRVPWQFSAWNEGDPNRELIAAATLDDRDFQRAFAVACGAVVEAPGLGADPTGGSTHYHADTVSPDWAKGHSPIAAIGRHKFYNDIP